MIPPLNQYIKYEIWPRRRRLGRPAHLVILAAAAALFIGLGPRWFQASPRVGDLTLGLISYAAVVLGFCVAALALSLTLPDREFVDFLIACPSYAGDDKSAYSDLLFVFSWTAVAHWAAIVALFAVMLFADSRLPLLPPDHSWWRVAAVTAVAELCIYCLAQFLTMLLALSQIGELYVDLRHLRRVTPPGRDAGAEIRSGS